MMFPGESSITAGEFFQNHEKYTSRACPFLSWALVGRVTTHQKKHLKPVAYPMSFKPMLQTPGMFQTISKNDRRSPCRRFADWSAGKKMNKGLSWKLMEVDGGSGFSANSEVFWYFAYLCIILHLQPWHLWRKWPDGHLPQRDPDCESKLTDLSRSPKGWHFWGPFPAGVGHHWALLWLPWTMARVPMTKA